MGIGDLAWLDWLVLALYFAVVMIVGFAARRKRKEERDFIQANRSMPFWAVGLSMLATALGADDFIGEPEFAFANDLALLGAFAVGYVGVAIVATQFLPKFYRSNALTIYGYLGQRFGSGAQIAASGISSVGGVVSAGVGMFVASFAVTPLLSHGDASYEQMRQPVLFVILAVGMIGTLYTTVGGIRSVIWTDVLQMVVVLAASGYAVWYLFQAIPLDVWQMVERWEHALSPAGSDAADSLNKLRFVRSRGGISDPYSPWTLPLWAVFFVGIFGTSHGFTQRLLTCRSARTAGIGMVFGYSVGMLSAVLFMLIGLLIYLFNDPAIMGETAGSVGVFTASEEVYPRLVVTFFPPGLLGLSLAGMLAAVMSSFDSSTAAISSTLIADVVRPLRSRRSLENSHNPNDDSRHRPPVLATAVTGAVLTSSGMLAAVIYDPRDSSLVDFALGISSFPLGGMIGVFCTALFTRRGNSRSVVLALAIAPLVWLFVQPTLLDMITLPLFGVSLTLDSLTSHCGLGPITLAWPWWFSIAAVASFGICAAGRPRQEECL